MDIKKLYAEYGPMVLRRCRHLLKDDQLAMDALQEVFMQVIKRKDRLHYDYPSSLLYTIATNQCLNIIREQKKKSNGLSFEDLLEQIALYDGEFEKFELRSLIDYLFRTQAASTRAIAILHYVDGLTLEETAEVSGLSVSGVRKRLAMLCKHMTSLRDYQNGTK